MAPTAAKKLGGTLKNQIVSVVSTLPVGSTAATYSTAATAVVALPLAEYREITCTRE